MYVLLVAGFSCCAGLQASTVAIIALGGRVPQIWMNYQRGNSGELSVATCMLNLFGNVARVYTTFVLTKVSHCIAHIVCSTECVAHELDLLFSAQSQCFSVETSCDLV